MLIYFIIRQVTPRRPSRFRFYFLPVIALYVAYQNLPKPTIPGAQIVECGLSVLIAIGFGFLQARYTELYQENGVWLMKGDWRYLASWLVLFAFRIATIAVFDAIYHTNKVIEWIVWIEIAAVWGIRSFALHLRYPQLKNILKRERKEPVQKVGR